MKDKVRNIAIVSMHSSPFAPLGMENTGGMNVYLKELSMQFCRMGLTCDIYTHAAFRGQTPVVAFARTGRLFNIQTSIRDVNDKHNLRHYCGEFADRMLAHKGSYDIIFSHYWLSGLVSIELSARLKLPFVQMFHTLAFLKSQDHVEGKSPDALVRGNLERQVMQQADCLIASTRMERAHMVEHYQAAVEKIKVVSPGVNVRKFRSLKQNGLTSPFKTNDSEKIILFVGRLQPLKGIDVLLKAMGRVISAQPGVNFRLVIVGGELSSADFRMNALRQLVVELGLENVIHFAGSKGQEELVQYYSVADVLVLPSLYESFGMVALEAMACGKPVVVTTACGVSTIIENGKDGIVIPPHDIGALADKLMLLLNTHQLKDLIGKAARTKAMNYQWQGIAQQLLQVFDHVAVKSERQYDRQYSGVLTGEL